MDLLRYGLSRGGSRHASYLWQGVTKRYLSTQPAATSSPTTHYRITLRRSAIGLPKHTGRVIEALGLRRRLQSVYHRQSPDIAGMVLAVKELVHVENVRLMESSSDLVDEVANPVWVNAQGEVVDAGRLSRKAPRGFKIVGNLTDEQRDAALRSSPE